MNDELIKPKLDAYGFEMIDVSKTNIPLNYVLIKLDGDHESYHSRETGEDTGIYVAPWGYNQASHLGLTGTVVKTPERLIYNGYDIAILKRDNMRSKADQQYIADLRKESMPYDVPMEVGPGDRVYFEYTTRLNAIKEGRRFETDEGVYVIIPYDLLVMRFKLSTDFNNVQVTDVYMLNGFLLIKILEYATDIDANGIRGHKTEMDLFFPEGKHPDARYVHKGNIWYATVLSCGCLVKAYADFNKAGRDFYNPDIEKPGTKIIFDGRQKKRMEVEHHRVIFKKHILHRIHRKDILGWFPNGKIN